MVLLSRPPSPLHVRVSHPAPPSWLLGKLESYFHSWQSGGGECMVLHDDHRGPDAFLVTFWNPADKEGVLKKENHHLIIDNDTVAIYLEPTENPTQENTSPQNSSLIPLREELRPDEKHPCEDYSPDAVVSSVQKVFLDVTADLNCDLFSKEQRNHIPILCPNVRRMEGSKGIEKVCGDYRDIEKINCHFSHLLLEDKLKHGSSASLEERPALGPPNWSSGATFKRMRPLHQSPEWFSNVTALEQKVRTKEESLHFEIPWLFFEYFKYVSPHKIDSTERKFGIKIKTQENFQENLVFLEFIKNESGDIDSALASFVAEFQKVTATLGQEHVTFPDRKKLHKIKQELALQFKSVLIKENEGVLTLVGPQDDITAAKHFLASPACDSLTKVSLKMLPPEYMVNGIEVDTFQYQLLTTELHKEISEIEEKYNTQSRVLVKGQRTFILFEPKDKELDLSVHAYVNFIDAYQDIASQLTQEILSLKSSGQKKKYFQEKKFSDDFRKNYPHVHFVPSEETVTLIGLPNLLAKAKQFVLQREGTSSLTEEKQSGDHETAMDIDSNSSTASTMFQHSASAGDRGVDDDKNLCSICMETIRDKKVLPKCKHEFCSPCIDKAMSYKPSCPLCQTNYGVQTGNQPEGTMEVHLRGFSLPGYKQFGTIEITYNMKGGIQTEKHPNPGKYYVGTQRKAYLPNNEEGKKVLKLLQRAFQQKLIFTVGNSRTSGLTDVITWNDIHHKTSISGGPEQYGYPDPDYLKRVKQELKDKGIEDQDVNKSSCSLTPRLVEVETNAKKTNEITYRSVVSELASKQTKEGLNLKLMSGDVRYFSADVIVNSVSRNLQLGRGPLSQALLQKGGPMLQEELSATQQDTKEKLGSLFLTSGCNLDCKAVLHVVAPHWNNGAQSSLQIMGHIIEKCLTEVERLGFQSIAFPMIGTGRLEFPKLIFAVLSLSEVIKFSRSSWKKRLQEVCFVVLPDDDQGYQAFLSAFNKLSSELDNMVKIPNTGCTHGTITTVSNPMSTMKEMKLGCVSFQVATGDLTKEKTDIIVNSTNRTLNEKSVEFPSNWDDMKQKNVSVIALSPHNEEYQTVASQFTKSCPTSVIKKIERIQNPALWKTYQTRKNIMDNKNGNVINEKLLFHGTDVNSVPHINKNGFNRSCAGKNAITYGKGTYFAVKASYSAYDRYSKPDANGEKYTYYVRVLTGVYTLGNSSLIVPPPKDPQNPTDLYDSVTDDMRNPKLFVVFYDYQAYPEYLITYRQYQ